MMYRQVAVASGTQYSALFFIEIVVVVVVSIIFFFFFFLPLMADRKIEASVKVLQKMFHFFKELDDPKLRTTGTTVTNAKLKQLTHLSNGENMQVHNESVSNAIFPIH